MLWTGLHFSLKKKKNFESFSVDQNLVIFQKKTHKNANLCYFLFLTPPFFRPETDKLPKKSHRPSQMTNVDQKHFGDIGTKIDGKNPQFGTPL